MSKMAKVMVDNLTKVPEALRVSLAHTRAQYRNLGNSGLRVSNPILGGLHFGSSNWIPWVLDEAKVMQKSHHTPAVETN